MKECTETDKPLISIVMATYNPRMDWLKEQLTSLENQTYRPLELIILDDCSPTVSLDAIRDCVEDCIHSMPYRIFQNEENVGSTKTFEKLTLLADGEYIAYCDQDDVWHEDKITELLACFIEDKISLAYSDVRLIDESGKITADSITTLRRRHLLYEGADLAARLLIQNFVIGCTMLIKSDIAKSTVPFISEMIHDHYLALMASLEGELALCKNPLVLYRIHEKNQTNTLTKVNNKQDYYEFKIKAFLDRIKLLGQDKTINTIQEFNDIKDWAEARDRYYNGDLTQATIIWKYRKIDYNISMFELIMLKMPDFLFQKALYKIKRGKI